MKSAFCKVAFQHHVDILTSFISHVSLVFSRIMRPHPALLGMNEYGERLAISALEKEWESLNRTDRYCPFICWHNLLSSSCLLN